MINRYLFNPIRYHFSAFVLTIIFSLVSVAFLLLEYYFVAKIINKVVFLNASSIEILYLLTYALLALVFRIIFEVVELKIARNFTEKILIEFRAQFLEKINDISKLELSTSGETYNLIDNGIDRLRSYYESYLPQLMKGVFIPLLFLSFILTKDMASALIMLVTIFLIPLFMILIGKLTKNTSIKQWSVLSRLSAYLKDILSGIETLKIIGESKNQYEKIIEFSQNYAKTTLKVQRFAFLSAFVLELVGTISIALIAVGLGLRLVEGNMDYEVAFLILLLSPEYYQPMRKLGALFHTSLDAESMSKDLETFLCHKDSVRWGNEILEKINCIEFLNVSYKYFNASKYALKDINFSLKKGETLGIIGHSGSGKTTIFRLLLGEISPTEGKILVNGKCLSSYTKDSYHKALGYVSQKPFLVQGSITENATLYDLNRKEKFLINYQNLYSNLPDGINTFVGEGGTNLSGGQTALIALARVYNSDKTLLLLDEPTSEIDVISEKIVVSSLEKLLKNRISLIIAHRIQTLEKLKKIIFVSEGKIIAYGTYEEITKTEVFSKIRRDNKDV